MSGVPAQWTYTQCREISHQEDNFVLAIKCRGKSHLHALFCCERIASALLMFRHFSGGHLSYQIFLEMAFSPISSSSSLLLAACCDTESGLCWSPGLRCVLWMSCVFRHSGTVESPCCTTACLELWNLIPQEDFLPAPTFLPSGDRPKRHQNPELLLQLHWSIWSLRYFLRTNNSAMFFSHTVFLDVFTFQVFKLCVYGACFLYGTFFLH